MGLRPLALSIAGSDPSGGAGVQADLKTFSAIGVYGAAIVTALTAQNTTGVSAVHRPPVDFLRAQCDAVFDDLAPQFVKLGMLGGADAIETVAEVLRERSPRFTVLDPVMVATSGDRLLEPAAERVLRERLFPIADLITPNLAESAAILGASVAMDEADMETQALGLLGLGARSVLLKGGHLSGAEASDLYCDQSQRVWLRSERIATQNTHGTGCTLSSAIAAFVAHGEQPLEACRSAKAYLQEALRGADSLAIGHGNGPVDHLFGLTPYRPTGG